MALPRITSIYRNPQPGKKIFVLSDFHLDASDPQSQEREKRICQWLDNKYPETDALFLLGDVFDFWYEYKYVVPKGYIRILSRLIRLTENNIPVYLIPGNHDLWIKDYLIKECGIQILEGSILLISNNKSIYMAHGDQLNKKKSGFYWLRKVFKAEFTNRLFRWIHPDISFFIAKKWSESSRMKSKEKNHIFLNANEPHLLFTEKLLKEHTVDFAIFGHRHLAYEAYVKGCRVINLGEWYTSSNYCEWDGDFLNFIKSSSKN